MRRRRARRRPPWLMSVVLRGSFPCLFWFRWLEAELGSSELMVREESAEVYVRPWMRCACATAAFPSQVDEMKQSKK
jgi:hypothetical protein